ncbi:interleukin-6 receptor subunit beta isoform X2 [Hypanus sabinus]|nr:interleukin-6 receptor subunit beta isoform X2 [Hypanus sabinus]
MRNCEHGSVPGSEDGPHDLQCYFTGTISDGFNCSWTTGTHHTNATLYKLNIHWKRTSGINTPTTIDNITGVFYTIPRKQLYISDNATIWVETMNMCQKSKSITLIPAKSERPEAPSNLKYSWQSGGLLLERKASKGYLYQILITKAETTEWQCFNLTDSEALRGLERQSAYDFRVRCKIMATSSIWSAWSKMYHVPPDLNKPEIYLLVTKPSLETGKRLVHLRWKKSDDTFNASKYGNTKYNITVGRLPLNSVNKNKSDAANNGEYYLNVSHAAFKVEIKAFNSASFSTSEIDIAPYVQMELRNKINATLLGKDSIFISWNSKETKKIRYVVDWGPVIGNETHIVQSKVTRNLHNYTLKGQFNPKQRYRIMLHKRPVKWKQPVTSEVTVGIVDVYTVEGTPSVGPTNVKVISVQKYSATIRWDHIPEDKCQGFLQGYKIFYFSKNVTNSSKVVSVNSSTTNYTLRGLLQKTFYTIEISGFTKAGEGAKSQSEIFQTKDSGDDALAAIAVLVCVAIIVFVFLVTWICSVLVKSIKKKFWPAIPNPGNSNAIQIIERVSSLPHLDSESSEQNSNLLDIKREEELDNLHTIEEITSSFIDYGLQENEPKNVPDQKTKHEVTQKPTVIQFTDYTTMENFQQIMSIIPSNSIQPTRNETEYNAETEYQRSDNLTLNYTKQGFHHMGANTTEGNPLVATECSSLLVNPDNITDSQALQPQGLLETDS